MNIYELNYKTPKGEEVLLSQLKNKVLLIVNTATKCGLAPQFEELEQLHQKYKEKGLVVIGFPSNQFANQEPESNSNIENACKINFGVTFPLSEKIAVNGKETHPVFQYLKDNSKQGLFGKSIKWNFTKFLISRDGNKILRFEPNVKPFEFEHRILNFLEELI